jgi:hypothetical protein
VYGYAAVEVQSRAADLLSGGESIAGEIVEHSTSDVRQVGRDGE